MKENHFSYQPVNQKPMREN